MKPDQRFGASGQKTPGPKGQKPHYGAQGQKQTSSKNRHCKPHLGAQGQAGAGKTAGGGSPPDRR